MSDGTLVLHYQPIVRISSGEVVGAEALCRWLTPMGIKTPMMFLPFLSGCILQEVCLYLAKIACREARELPIWVSINLNPSPINDGDFVKTLAKVLSDNQGCGQLVLELTEEAAFDNYALITLRELGYPIAIDDWGTGWSNLFSLITYQPEIIKLDKQLTSGIAVSNIHAEVVIFALHMASRMGIHVIAEGIETEGQVRFLGANGCTYGQGWYWSKALSLESLKLLINSQGVNNVLQESIFRN